MSCSQGRGSVGIDVGTKQTKIVLVANEAAGVEAGGRRGTSTLEPGT